MEQGSCVHTTMYLVTVIIAAFLQQAACSKVLLVPLEHPGHVNFLIVGGQALANKGHEVHMFAMETYRQKILNAGLKPITWKPKKAISVFAEPEFQRLSAKVVEDGKSIGHTYNLYSFLISRLQFQCEEFLSNAEVMRNVAEEQFDIALVDGNPFVRCLYTLPWMHHIKYISVTLGIEPWAARVPAMPSVEPIQILTVTNDMSFFERVASALIPVIFPFLVGIVNDPSMLSKYAGNRTERSFEEIYSGSEMFFVNNAIYLLDYPRVSAPHYVFLGGMGGKPAKPLTPELERFVSSSDTLVVVSFGSIMKLSDKMFSAFLQAFKKHEKVNFVMRFQGDPTVKIPKNVKILKWLPQNDLLGNPKTKLFITHGGNNGQLEGLYHGVPMVVAPGFADQHYNALRLLKRKYGKVISLLDSPEKISSTIKEVLENEMYKMNIQKAANIYRALPLANDTLAFWVDHVLKYGSDHIRCPYSNIPLYKLFMLDVLLFLCLIVFVTLSLIYICCWRLICRRTKKHVKQE